MQTVGYSPALTTTFVVVLSSVVFIGVLENVAVCVAIFTYEALQKINYSFIISLAVADMLVCLLSMGPAVWNEVMRSWPFGQMFCKVWVCINMMSTTASMLNMCVISRDRYTWISSPFTYWKHMTKQRAALYLAGVWMIALCTSFVPVYLGWNTPVEGSLCDTVTTGSNSSNSSIVCESAPLSSSKRKGVDDMCRYEKNFLFALVYSTVHFYVPCVIIVYTNTRLFLKAREHMKTSRMSGDRQFKAAKTLGVITGSFLVCWLPYYILQPVLFACEYKCIPISIDNVVTCLGYFNSCLNPVIYTVFLRDFRAAFKQMFGKLCCEKVFLNAERETTHASNESVRSSAPIHCSGKNSKAPEMEQLSAVSTHSVTIVERTHYDSIEDSSSHTPIAMKEETTVQEEDATELDKPNSIHSDVVDPSLTYPDDATVKTGEDLCHKDKDTQHYTTNSDLHFSENEPKKKNSCDKDEGQNYLEDCWEEYRQECTWE